MTFETAIEAQASPGRRESSQHTAYKHMLAEEKVFDVVEC